MAKLSGFAPIIATASPHNESLVRSLGATHFVDRSLSEDVLCAAVSSIATSPLDIIYGTIGTPDTQRTAYYLLACGGTLVSTVPVVLGAEVLEEGKRAIQVKGSVYIPSHQNKAAALFGAIEGLTR